MNTPHWLRQSSFNFPGRINHPEPLFIVGTETIEFFLKFQLPRTDKPSGTGCCGRHYCCHPQFQLPRTDKPSGTAAPSRPVGAACRGFNFPGRINHPEPLNRFKKLSHISQFQLPRTDKPSGTVGLENPRAAAGLKALSAQLIMTHGEAPAEPSSAASNPLRHKATRSFQAAAGSWRKWRVRAGMSQFKR